MVLLLLSVWFYSPAVQGQHAGTPASKMGNNSMNNAFFLFVSDLKNVDNFWMKNLVGDTLYFPERYQSANGNKDSISPFENMIADKPILLENMSISWADGKVMEELPKEQFNITDAKNNGWHYIHGYCTRQYMPQATAWVSSKRLDISTPYHAVEGKYFKVVNAYDSVVNEYVYYLIFKLEDANHQFFTWVIGSRELAMQNALFIKPLNQLKQQYQNKKIYLKERGLPYSLYDIATQKNIPVHPYDEYTVTDVLLLPPRKKQSMEIPVILAQKGSDTIAIALGNEDRYYYSNVFTLNKFISQAEYDSIQSHKQAKTDSIARVVEHSDREDKKATQQKYNNLIKKYGKATTTQILQHRVSLGYGKAVCAESWGEPVRVTKTTYRDIITETWHYKNGQWLRFKNGILTGYSQLNEE
ncbi:MAG: hypothetical protein EBX41_08785 [Chitinophagia bacterium]|nr:hypothetical protein [Chitinophagia bacterium]